MSLSSTCIGNTENEEANIINLVYNFDWSSTSLGPMDSWEPVIKTVMGVCLRSTFPICLHIGPPEWILLYNKGFSDILKTRHPFALGKSTKEVWPEICEIVISQLEEVRKSGKGMFKKDEYFELERDGYKEESYFNYTFSPIFKSDGTVWAIMNMAQETTQRVLNARRLKVLSEFGNRTSD
ncbi:16134_t:CDS:2 [Dentiscutata heterogama]|uniref:16134_t:CDS:1 n=1 Tax=Dentiscutata heterogama TaxID=1316150 RepID=A0ACA9K5U1_9GLOM|nr:16134_t:CDS:2 [Dentiscutata heterogama]